MRRLMPWILALLLAPTLHAQSTAPAPAAEELTRLLKEFLDGVSRNDVAAHERFWADDLIYTRSAGMRIGKKEILAEARSGPHAADAVPTTYSAEDIRIQQYGDTAVIAFRLVGTMGSGEQAVVMNYLNTGTFVRRGGEWRAVAWQSTRVPEPEQGNAEPQRPAPKMEAAIKLTPGVKARPGLHEEVREADAVFFRAFFDTCDIETVRRYVADDFEMFHDKDGRVSTSGAEFVKITQDLWKEERGQWRLARVLSYDHELAE